MQDYSQFGQSAVLHQIVTTIPGLLSDNPWIVEYGANDGTSISNAKMFIESMGFKAVLIEADEELFQKLQQVYQPYPSVHTKFGKVDENNLANILTSCGVPKEFEILCVDIDSGELLTLRGLGTYCPKVIQIEFDNFFHPATFHQPEEFRHSNQASLMSTLYTMRDRGYSLHSTVGYDALFVRNDLYQPPWANQLEAAVAGLVKYGGYTFNHILFGSRNKPGGIPKGWEFIKMKLQNLLESDIGKQSQILEAVWSARCSIYFIKVALLTDAEEDAHRDIDQVLQEIQAIYVHYLQTGKVKL